MSSDTPNFTEALETLAKALNINFSTLAGDLFEDVELAKEAFLKRAKNEKSDVEKEEAGAQSRKFNSVDFWPAMDSKPEDLDAALASLGVDTEDDKDSVECSDGADCARCEAIEKANSNTTFHVQDIDEAITKFPKATHVPVEEKPELSKWDVAIRDRDWASWAVVEAEYVETGADMNGNDIGFTAYQDGEIVFYAPAGSYHYVRKVA